MINIICNPNINRVTGPNKVVKNLVLGLNKINYPYCINKDIRYTKFIFIPNTLSNLVFIRNKYLKGKTIIGGPNLIDVPYYGYNYKFKIISSKLKLFKYYIVHSEWYYKIYKIMRYNLTDIKIWPVGINLEEIKLNNNLKKNVLVYYKKRTYKELMSVLNFLDKKNEKYLVLDYDKGYKQSEYYNILSNTKYVIWVGIHETQGLAYLEALAHNVPILVYDVKLEYQKNPFYKKYNYISKYSSLVEVTSVPYFDNKCGIKFFSIDELPKAFEQFMDLYYTFRPREYIELNFDLVKRAHEFINFFHHETSGKFNYRNTIREIRDIKLSIWHKIYKVSKCIRKKDI